MHGILLGNMPIYECILLRVVARIVYLLLGDGSSQHYPINVGLYHYFARIRLPDHEKRGAYKSWFGRDTLKLLWKASTNQRLNISHFFDTHLEPYSPIHRASVQNEIGWSTLIDFSDTRKDNDFEDDGKSSE